MVKVQLSPSKPLECPSITSSSEMLGWGHIMCDHQTWDEILIQIKLIFHDIDENVELIVYIDHFMGSLLYDSQIRTIIFSRQKSCQYFSRGLSVDSQLKTIILVSQKS